MIPKHTSVADAYGVLGLEHGSSLETVKTTYKQLALRTHPDKNPGNEDATAQFQRVSEAYNVLLKHLDTSSAPRGGPRGFGFFPGRDDDEDYGYDDYDEDEYYAGPDEDDYDGLDFYMFLFENLMRNGAGGFARSRYSGNPHPHAQYPEPKPETPEQYKERIRRAREDQIAAQERRKQEAIARKARAEADRERERLAAEARQRAKVEEKKAQVETQRKKAENKARAIQQRTQTVRSAVFAAARSGNAAAVKKGVYEDECDAAGPEIKTGSEECVKSRPRDPKETLLHITAKRGDTELVEWLNAHGADPEERNSAGLTAFHVALAHGHASIIKQFFESYPPDEEDSAAIYDAPAPKTLLSISLESHEPQVVFMVLDKGLASTADIGNAWTSVCSSTQQVKGADAEKTEDIRKLLMTYGGFTPPHTPRPSVHARDEKEARSGASTPSISSPSEELSSQAAELNAIPEPVKKTTTGRGRGRGGRGRGRGRGKGKST